MRFFQVKPAIYYGEGSLKQIESFNFKKVCIATDQGMVKFGLLKMLTDLLDEKGIDIMFFRTSNRTRRRILSKRA